MLEVTPIIAIWSHLSSGKDSTTAWVKWGLWAGEWHSWKESCTNSHNLLGLAWMKTCIQTWVQLFQRTTLLLNIHQIHLPTSSGSNRLRVCENTPNRCDGIQWWSNSVSICGCSLFHATTPSGVMKLPSERTLRDYTNVIKSKAG